METINKERGLRETHRSFFDGIRDCIVVISMLTAIMPFVAGCTASETTRVDEPSITADIDQLVNDYFASYNNYDADAVEALVTEGYELVAIDSSLGGSPKSCAAWGAEEMFGYVKGYNKQHEYHFERVGELIVSGTGPWLASQVILETTKHDPDGFEGISTLIIIEEGDQLKIDRDVFVYNESE